MTTRSVSLEKSSPSHTLASTLTRAVSRYWQAFRARRQIAGLLAADRHMLADIGLSRADVIGALEAPFDTDPSYHLIRARAERMASRARRLRR